MKFIYSSPRGIGTIIDADFKNQTITIENHTDVLLDTAFGVNKHPTWQQFEEFLESRCFPRTRDKMKLELRQLGLDFYDPLSIIQKTEGRMAEDDCYLEIKEQEKINDNSEDFGR